MFERVGWVEILNPSFWPTRFSNIYLVYKKFKKHTHMKKRGRPAKNTTPEQPVRIQIDFSQITKLKDLNRSEEHTSELQSH